MKLARQLSEIPYDRNSVVTVGSFDGMHRAHQEILRETVHRARRRSGRSILITFEPHPREIVGGQQGVELLTSLEEKQQVARDFGIDLFFTAAFDYNFSRQTSREFYKKYLIEGTGVSEVVEGFDHHFGRDREGSVREVQRLAQEFSFVSFALEPFLIDNQPVNSTRIRELLKMGDIVTAKRLLGRPYSVDGVVSRGNMRGRTLGYPTANIEVTPAKKLVPKDGIYFVRVLLGAETRFGITSIGVRPTFENNGQRIVEVYILDFQADIYGHNIRVIFERRLRDEIRFASAEELIVQMNRDKEESVQLKEQYQAAAIQ